MAAAKKILKESQMLKEIAKEKELQAKAKQTEAKQSNIMILRKERMKTCQQIKIRKEQVLQERKTNKELFQSIKEMEKNLTALQQELQYVKKGFAQEREKRLQSDKKIEYGKTTLHDEKKKRYIVTQEKVQRIEKKEKEIAELREVLFEMSDEVKDVQKENRKLRKTTRKAEELASSRLKRLREGEELIDQLKLELLDNKPVVKVPTKDIRKERIVGRRGGGQRWPVWVVQMICEMLTNGAPPSAIPGLIKIMMETFTSQEVKTLPSIRYVRHCRLIVQILGETMAAIKLGRGKYWQQLFTDGTTRRQISFQNVVIGLMGERNSVNPVVVSSCIFLENETSEKQVEAVLYKVCNMLAICMRNKIY